ncbi:MAG: 2OG-Fe(II) oxygenase [Myxococcales bacterium]|nr:2OG-Fe(II) oxygenase [Myxococcales bacterium]
MACVWPYRVKRDALPRADFDALRDALLTSPLVGRSTLTGPFQSSRGFAVIFRAEGIAKVTQRFAPLAAYLPAILGAPGAVAVAPFWRRTHRRTPNAWYLNVLLVSEGGTVGRHVDATLRKPAEAPEAIPECVSVLYLDVPKARGGQLKLYLGRLPVGSVRPQDNQLVHFHGGLSHEVCAFSGAPGAVRASLVVEQYHFAPEVLARLPAFQLDSRAGFAAYLDAHARREATRFELEE